MLDLKLLREDLFGVAEQLAKRGFELDLATVKHLEAKRKGLQIETEQLQQDRNQQSKAIGQAKSKGDNETSQRLLLEVATLGDKLKIAEEALGVVQKELHDIYAMIPNTPHLSVPLGKT